MVLNGRGQRVQVASGEMLIQLVGSQKRTEGTCGEFDGTEESLRTHIGDRGTGQGLLDPRQGLEEDR